MLDHDSAPSEAEDVVSDRARLVKALIHLSVAYGPFPTSLQIPQVQKDEDPIDFGMAGEVYQGRFADRAVAVKVFKACKANLKDLPTYLKVRYSHYRSVSTQFLSEDLTLSVVGDHDGGHNLVPAVS